VGGAFARRDEEQVAKRNGGRIKNEDESASCNFGGDNIAIRAFRGEDGGAASSQRRVVADIRRTHFSLVFR
jgi:hypothetical protein